MATQNQLVTTLILDNGQFTSNMTEVSDHVRQTTEIIQVQDQSWRSLSGSALSAASKIVGPVLGLASAYRQMQTAQLLVTATQAASIPITSAAVPPTLALGAAVNFLLSPVVLTAAAIAALAGTVYYFTQRSSEAVDSANKMNASAGGLSQTLSAFGSVKQSFVAGFLGTEGLDALAELQAAGSELYGAFVDLGDALLQPLRDAGFEIGSLANFMSNFTERVRQSTELVRGLTSGVNEFAASAKSAVNSLTLIGVMAATGMGAEDAQKSIDARAAMRAATIEAIEMQRAEQFAGKELASLMESATEQARQRAEVTRIGGITSIESLDAETKALQEQITSLERKREYTAEAKRQAEEMAGAITKQRVGIESGDILSESQKQQQKDATSAARQLENLKNTLGKLTMSEREYSLSAFAATSATDDQMVAFDRLLEQIEKANKEKEKAASNSAAEGELSRLNEQIERMNGSATSASQALEKMLKDSVSADVIEKIKEANREIERLTDVGKNQNLADRIIDSIKTPAEKLKEQIDEINRLTQGGFLTDDQAAIARQKAEADFGQKGGGNRSPFSPAVLEGTREAGSAIIRASANATKTNPNKKLEDLQQKSNELEKAAVDEMKDFNALADDWFNAQPMVANFR